MPIREMPQSNKQHAVPQNIMDVEFKLIGDLTMRQFTYLAVFLGFAYVIYTFKLPVFFKWPIILFVVLGGAAFAFVPYEERGLDEWIVNFFKAAYAEQQYVWRKNPVPPSAFLYQNLSIMKQELITLAPTASRRKLENYLEYQKQKDNLDPIEKLEANYIQKVKDAFKDYVPEPKSVGVAVEDNVWDLPQTEAGTSIETTDPQLPYVGNDVSGAQPITDIPQKQNSALETIVSQETTATKKDGSEEIQQRPPLTTQANQDNNPNNRIQPKQKLKKLLNKPAVTMPSKTNDILLKPVTPDMHAGRKLINLSPFQGNIVLPIRGERTIKTSEEIESQNDVLRRADQLKGYIQQLRQAEKLPNTPMGKSISIEKHVEEMQLSSEAQDLINKFEKEKNELTSQIETLKAKIQELAPNMDSETKEQNSTKLKELEDKESKAEEAISKLREQVDSIQGKPATNNQEDVEEKSTGLGTIPSYVQPQAPNIVAGVVRNITGGGLPNVLSIIKNRNSEPVRAVKTNPLGEFAITNPLPNGSYTIEIDVNNSTGFTFDIINFEANGEIIPAIEFVGR